MIKKKNTHLLLLNILLIGVLAIIFLSVPNAVFNKLPESTLSGKMFLFSYLSIIGFIIFLFKLLFQTNISLKISPLDIILLIWVIYTLINGFTKQLYLTQRLFELVGLIILYILFRQVRISNYGILLLSLSVGVTLQAIYGNLQLWGIFTSYNENFKMTGSFFNPGPFAGYLSSVFPIILCLAIFKLPTLCFYNEKIKEIITWIAGIFIILAVVAARSRAAYLALIISSVFLFIKRYHLILYIKSTTFIKRVSFIIIIVFIVIGGICGLVKIRSESVHGRLLIWNVTTNLIKEHPLTGIGFDHFKAFYMEKQADYFMKNPNSEAANVAGDTNYCFNEFLQHTAENGIIGFILIIVVLITSLSVKNKKSVEILWMAKSGIISIAIFGLFSYPTQILPIKINLVFCLALLSSLRVRKQYLLKIQWQRLITKVIFVILIVFSILFCFKIIPAYYRAWEKRGLAYQAYLYHDYETCFKAEKEAWPYLKSDGDYLNEYGKFLSSAGKYKSALPILIEAKLHFPNIITYTSLGNTYKALGKNNDAEQAYMRAIYMNPSRLYIKYLLTILYDDTGQEKEAKKMALEILNKKVKIQSTAVSEIKDKMKIILDKNKKCD